MAKRQRIRAPRPVPRRRPYRPLYLLAGQVGVRLCRALLADPFAPEHFPTTLALLRAAMARAAPPDDASDPCQGVDTPACP